MSRQSGRINLRGKRSSKSSQQPRREQRLFTLLEQLEGRTLYSTTFIQVINTNDSGTGSLRDAITAANGTPGSVEIDFAIPSNNPGDIQTISLLSPLDPLSNQITVNGTTQSGYAGSPLIVIDGSASALGGNAISAGLELDGSGEVVRGLGVEGFADEQVLVVGNGNTIQSSVIGIGTDSSAPGVQGANGIVINGDSNTIDSDIISGNGNNGVLITGNSNTIKNSTIGLDDTGAALGNNNNGIEADGSTGVTISGNTIDSNNGDGIQLNSVSGGSITGNMIGVDQSGELAFANSVHGISLTNTTGVTIGGATLDARNVIGGNFSDGILLYGSSSNTIKNNYIGTDAGGTLAIDAEGNDLANSGDGINLQIDTDDSVHPIDSTNNTITGNLIAANFASGIEIKTNSTTTKIQGNFIGTDKTGNVALGNAGDGIQINSGGATIGGSTAGQGNVIGGNGQNGITLASGSTVKGNFIGVGADGSTALGNGVTNNGVDGAGIFITGSSNTIGGTGASDGNVVEFNSRQGVVVSGGQNNSIRGNSIYANTRIGIDLGNDGVTPNKAHDHLGGSNQLQNFPTISAATMTAAGSMNFIGSLTTSPGTYFLDFYSSPLGDASGFGEGKNYIGSMTITVGSSGSQSFNVSFLSAPTTDTVLAVTATDAAGNTSEFSAAAPLSLIANASPDATSTTISSSLNPSKFGQSVTITATVTDTVNGTNIPSGVVDLMDGTSQIGTGTLDASGHVTFTITNFIVGSHSLTAVYEGAAAYVSSTSGLLAQVVNKATTSATITSSVNPSKFGQSTTLAATVTSAAGTPSGVVTFMDGTTVLGTGTLANGVATFTISSLGVGHHNLTAVYGSDTSFDVSTSSLLDDVVQQASTSASLSSSQNPSSFGQSVTFSATVSVTSPGAGNPSGSIVFMDGTTVLGTVALSGNSASLTLSTLSVGGHTITAVYTGDPDFAGSTSAPITQTVNQVATTTTLGSSVNPSTFGQSVTLTANVSSTTSGTISGNVTFMEGTTVLGTVVLSNGAASLTLATLGVGGHTITAVYTGDTNFTGSSDTLTQTVNQASSTTALSSSLNPSGFGQNVTFTANVTSGATGSINGSILFKDGNTVLGTVNLTNGSASIMLSSLSVGGHTITATYSGDTNFSGSTATLAQTVNAASTSIALNSSLNPSGFSQSVTFTANVTSGATGSITGGVQFEDGNTILGTVNLTNGSASIMLSTLAVGGHTITATYSGDTNFSGSSATLSQTVNQAATTTTLASSTNPSVFGQGVTLTASVASGATGSITGSVTFEDGSTVLGTVNLTNGSASITLGSVVVGGHTITATYSGDTNFSGSGATLTQTVNKAGTTTTLASSSSTITAGQSVTLTATVGVVSPGAGAPSGLVTFMDGTNVLGMGTVSNGVATFTTTSLGTGTHTITAVYAGDGSFNTSTSSPLTELVSSTPATLSGYAYLDANDDGMKQVGESGIAGVSVTLTGTNDLGTIAPITVVTDSNGYYSFQNLRPGSYTIRETQPAAYLDGKESVGSLGGTVGSDQFSNVSIGAGANGQNYNFGEVQPGSLEGFVFVDLNNNGQVDLNDTPIAGVTVTLSGTDDLGHSVQQVTTTDAQGSYRFDVLRPGTYAITETQPSGVTDGKDTLGTINGVTVGTVGSDKFSQIAIPAVSGNGINYNFFEQGSAVHSGEAATIGFWQNKNGQALIQSVNGSASATSLGNWLAMTFPHLYGAGSPTNLANRTNAQLASFYQTLFGVSGQKLDAQVMAVALASYVTDQQLAGGTYGTKYGFLVSDSGLGDATYNIGSNGAAFGVASNTTLTIYDILHATDSMSGTSGIYDGSQTLRNLANTVYNGINQGGDIA